MPPRSGAATWFGGVLDQDLGLPRLRVDDAAREHKRIATRVINIGGLTDTQLNKLDPLPASLVARRAQ
jgi:hypothetical protein